MEIHWEHSKGQILGTVVRITLDNKQKWLGETGLWTMSAGDLLGEEREGVKELRL